MVLECVPSSLAATIRATLSIPVVGIGAGREVDAQVLVFHDLVGLSGEFQPRFVRRYAEVHEVMCDAVKRFCEDVASGAFPSPKESFSMPGAEDVSGEPEGDPEKEFSG